MGKTMYVEFWNMGNLYTIQSIALWLKNRLKIKTYQKKF